MWKWIQAYLGIKLVVKLIMSYVPPAPPRRNDDRKKPEKKPKNPCHVSNFLN